MIGRSKSVFGIYKTRAEVETAVDALKFAGFRSADISVLLADENGSNKLNFTKETKASEGAATGAGTGIVLGGALGWLVGIGALAIPGVGPLIAAGPMVAALAGAGLVGTVGGLAGAMIGLGMPEFEAKRYEGFIRSGGILLSVHSDDPIWTKRAEEILETTGAHDVSTVGDNKADWKGDPSKPRDSDVYYDRI